MMRYTAARLSCRRTLAGPAAVPDFCDALVMVGSAGKRAMSEAPVEPPQQ
jgi:hypothetical protein